MGTKTIGLRDEVYERLRARKRDEESFSDLVDRLLSETENDWREGFGILSDEEADELQRHVEASRGAMNRGLSQSQAEVLEKFSRSDDESLDKTNETV